MANQNRRRDYTVSKPIQRALMLTWVTSILLLLNVSILFYSGSQLNAKVDPEYFKVMGVNGFYTLVGLSLFLVVIAITVCINIVILAHRMIGSSFAIRKTIKELREGNFDAKVRLREGDYFLDVADELNKFIAQLRGESVDDAPAAPQQQIVHDEVDQQPGTASEFDELEQSAEIDPGACQPIPPPRPRKS